MIDKPPNKRKIAHLLALQCEGCSAAPMCLFCQSFLVKCMCSELNQSLNKATLLALQQYTLPNLCICDVPHTSLFAMFYWCFAEELNSLDAGKEMGGWCTAMERSSSSSRSIFPSTPLSFWNPRLGWVTSCAYLLPCLLACCCSYSWPSKLASVLRQPMVVTIFLMWFNSTNTLPV